MFCCLSVCWQKTGSFDFAEGLASGVGAKANVTFVGRLNFKIFVRWVKKLKHIFGSPSHSPYQITPHWGCKLVGLRVYLS